MYGFRLTVTCSCRILFAYALPAYDGVPPMPILVRQQLLRETPTFVVVALTLLVALLG